MHKKLLLFGLCWLSAAVLGCGGRAKDTPKLGTVTGIIKMDGQPLPKATVVFAPDNSRQSGGTTNEQGKYELMFNGQLKGAAIGKHKVRITTGTAMEPQKIPANYNYQTVLSADVKEGKNDINFDLKSK